MLTISFETDNDAYRDYEEVDGDAVAESVESVAKALREGFTSGRVVDMNGNHVGDWSLTV